MSNSGLFGTGIGSPQLDQARLQPTAVPGSTYVRPQERKVGGNLEALASALGGLNSALQNFATVKDREEDDPNARANKEWIARRQQMSLEDLRNEARMETHDGIRVRQDALELMLGERANDDFRRAWMEFYNTDFDRTSGDAAGAYEEMRQEYASGLPSEVARGNFYRLTGDHFRAWMEKDVEQKVSYAKDQLNTTVVDSFRNSVDDAMNIHGKSAQEAAEIIFAKSASNRDFLGLSGQEQNDTIFALAEEYAEQGREDLARALLEGGRKGADGKPLPPLMDIPRYSTKAIKLIERAGNLHDAKVREDGMSSMIADDDLVLRGAFTEAEAEKRRGSGLYTDAQLAGMVDQSAKNLLAIRNKAATTEQKRALRRQSELEEAQVYSQAYSAMSGLGGINRIRDVEVSSTTGEGSRTLSKQSIIDEVVEMREEDFTEEQERLISVDKMDPDKARQAVNRMRVDWYAGNGIQNRKWSNTLNSIAGRATIDTLLQKGEVSDYLRNSAELYRQLKAVNPAYLKSHVLTNKSSQEFLETYEQELNRGVPSDDALLSAATWVAQPEAVKAKSMLSIDATDKLAVSTLRGLDLDHRNSNYAYVADRISSMSKHGATEDEIRDELEKEILETAVPINGVLVHAHRDLPDDFPELIQEELEAIHSALPDSYGIEDASDLFVVADGAESKWTIWSKSLRMPIGASPITPKSLEARRQVRVKAREERIRKLAGAKEAERGELKRRYDKDIAATRERISYWEDLATKRKGLRGSLAGRVAKALQEDLDDRLSKDRASVNGEVEKFKAMVRQDMQEGEKDRQERIKWLRSLIPSVKIGGRTVIE